jgi:hypothetical protein
MANERGRNKKKREQKKIKRLERLLSLNLCACGGGHQLQCRGACKEAHTNSKTKEVECKEMYQIDRSAVKLGGPRRPKRTWKYGRQKDGDEKREAKDRRREKRERDQLQR